MAQVLLDEKLVYLALRGVFVGEHAQLRKRKAIHKVICERKQEPGLQSLIQAHGVNDVTRVAKVLLVDQIFASRLRAKARFPEAFQVTDESIALQAKDPILEKLEGPAAETSRESNAGQSKEPDTAQIDEPVVEKAETTVKVAAVPGAGNSATKEFGNIDLKEGGAVSAAGEEILQSAAIQTTPQLNPQPRIPTPPLDYVSLPFWYQHRIMVRVQHILEKACFTFAQKRLADVLQREAWDCAEAVELTQWTKVLHECRDEFVQSDLENARKPLSSLMTSISQLRHTAVHRLRLPARSALELVADAEALGKLLQNDECLEQISATRQQLEDSIEGLERNKRSLEARLAEIRQRFIVERIKLESKEAALLEAAEKESRERDFFGKVCSDDTLDALRKAQARWKGIDSVSLPAKCPHDTHGLASASSDPERTFEDEATGTEKEGPKADVPLFPHLRSDSKFDDERSSLRGPNNDSSYEDWSMTTTTEKTDHDYPEESKAAPALDTLSLHGGTFPIGTLPKLNTSLPSPCSSYCEDYATPWHSRSPVEETSSVVSDGAYFETEPSDASASLDTFCPFRALHLLEEQMWQHCDRCRAFLFQTAGQLAHITHADSDESKGSV